MKTTTLAAAIAAAILPLTGAHSAIADQAETDARIRELSTQIETLRKEVDALRAAQSQPTGVVATPTAGATVAESAPPAAPASAISFTGYGEANYTQPSGGSGDAIADLTRVVFGVGYQFDERTRLEVEAEWEHAVTSADDEGEVAIEQAYIAHQFGDNMQLNAGLFLIPMGIINERHEPPVFFGVFRPLTETAIIPTTWREGGVSVLGSTQGGLQWSLGITTGFNLAKWDPTSLEGQESPLGSIHQEMSLAVAEDISIFGSLKYTGIPGLTLGAAVFTGGAGQGQPAFPADDSQATLWSAYARWMPRNWQLTALFAEGYLSDTADLNLTFIGNPSPVPSRFWGGYAEVSYHGWAAGSWRLAPFARIEQFNTGAEFARIGQGLTPTALDTETVTTLGTSLFLTSSVVFKLDYQFFSPSNAALGYEDRVNLGVGYMY
jgi:outer membrane murein-binding lipoprotein Lpp